ncbi:MAG TPA: Gfo/Idh/MocA family oxidoreductase [Acidimicrobiales bacterium]|nr:Gfo/Idh/MocA family oxidoreductase [Acidimicrobiales bacterium]
MTTRVAIIGCGFIGGIHSRALKGLIGGGLVDARVVAVADADTERAAAFGAAHRADVVTDDPAIAMADADAVWICTPTSSHRALVEGAAAAGLAVYCEKPLATSVDDVLAMVDCVETAGVPHQVGLVLRAAGPIATLQRLATDSPTVGRPMAVVFRDDQYFPNQGQYGSGWRADVAVAGGGTLIEHSIHDLDVLAWVLGPVRTVTCRTANFAGHEGIEDVAALTAEHASGATSSLISVWHQVLSRPSTRRIEVFCERAFVWLDDDMGGPVHLVRDGGDQIVPTPTAAGWIDQLAVPPAWRPGLAAYAAADRAFLTALAAGTRPAPGFDVAVAAHLVADAAYRSAGLGGAPTPVAGPGRVVVTGHVREDGHSDTGVKG